MYSSGSNTLDTEFSSLQTKVNQKTTLTEVINKLYPVGTIYMAIGGSSPASRLGGSWTQIVGKYIRAKNSSQDSGSTGGNNNVTLSAANIPTLSMQVGLCDGGYVGANDHPDSFISNSKTLGMEDATYSGDTSDRSAQKGYVNSSLVRYYNSSVKSFTVMPEYINVNCWQRVS